VGFQKLYDIAAGVRPPDMGGKAEASLVKESVPQLGGKQRCMDRFLSKFNGKDGKPPWIAYGASKFAPTGKGEIATPVGTAAKRVKDRFQHFVSVDEFRTSQTCHVCLQRLTLLKYKDGSRLRDFCKCEACRTSVHRDFNAAINILKLAIGARPPAMSRNGPN